MSAQLMVLITVLLVIFVAIWVIDGSKPAFACLAASFVTSGIMYSLINFYTYLGFRLL